MKAIKRYFKTRKERKAVERLRKTLETTKHNQTLDDDYINQMMVKNNKLIKL